MVEEVSAAEACDSPRRRRYRSHATAIWSPRVLGALIGLGALVFVLPNATMRFMVEWTAAGPSAAYSVSAALIVGLLALAGGLLFALRRPLGWWLVFSLGVMSLAVSVVLLAMVSAFDGLGADALKDALAGIALGLVLLGLLVLRPLGGPGARAWRSPRAALAGP